MVWLAVLLVAGGLAYWFPVRRTCRQWGTRGDERWRPLRGDDVVPYPTYEATFGITIDAPPNRVFPWLVQMGYQRGGLYSYDWLDRLFGYLDRPSSDRLLSEFQTLAVGDVIPVGRGAGFPVKMIDPNRALVLGEDSEHASWMWEFDLSPLAGGQTRLVTRTRARVPRTLGWRLFMLALEPAAFLMTRKMLLGIKRRAEALVAAERACAARAAHGPQMGCVTGDQSCCSRGVSGASGSRLTRPAESRVPMAESPSNSCWLLVNSALVSARPYR